MLINCPDNFDLSFARELLSSFGADVSIICPGDCWGHLAEKFAEYRPQVEAYFECATTGNPAYGAMCMARECGSSREWAERVTEAATTGDPSYVAFRLVRGCGSSREWAERLMENATIGDPASAAVCMTYECGSSREWAERLVERVNIGCPAFAGYELARYCGSSCEWAEKIIESATTDDVIRAAKSMVRHCGSSPEWAERVRACSTSYKMLDWASSHTRYQEEKMLRVGTQVMIRGDKTETTYVVAGIRYDCGIWLTVDQDEYDGHARNLILREEFGDTWRIILQDRRSQFRSPLRLIVV